MAFINFNPQDYFNTVLYTGTGSSLAVTGCGFQPNLTWIKCRDVTNGNFVYDSLRGADTAIMSNNSDPTATYSGLTSFDSDGFTVGTFGDTNTNTKLFASWNWKAGTTTVPSGGSITPSAVAIDTTAKQGIYKWTGTGANATIAHGLGAAPQLMFVKNCDTNNDWNVYHMAKGPNFRGFLNTTGDFEDQITGWNDTAPTTTEFSIGTNTNVNQSGDTMVAYVFCAVKGYSKMGIYEGNGSSSAAPFTYTGFRPAWILIKRLASSNNWFLWNDKDAGYNPDNNCLNPNTTAANNTSDFIKIFSNGFTFMTTDSEINGDAGLYVYAAFASNPMVDSNGNPALAR
jgi:hypothetical protein